MLFCALKGGGWSTPHRGKPDLIITTGIAWLYRVTFNSRLGIIPAGLFFFEKEINDMRKEQSIKTNKLRKESLFIWYARVVCAVILRAVFWKETAMKRIISLADFASMMQWSMTVRWLKGHMHVVWITWIREPCFKMKRHTGNVCHICYCTLNFENAA